jgi:hypothetical protein
VYVRSNGDLPQRNVGLSLLLLLLVIDANSFSGQTHRL